MRGHLPFLASDAYVIAFFVAAAFLVSLWFLIPLGGLMIVTVIAEERAGRD